MIVNVSMELTVEQAFEILLKTLRVNLDDDSPKFEIEDGEIVCDCDDRGELYLALYHLATKIFPNTDFRSLFDDPNTLMAKLYIAKESHEVIKMRDATPEERESIDKYINNISKPTGVSFEDLEQKSNQIAYDVGGHTYGVIGGDEIMRKYEGKWE